MIFNNHRAKGIIINNNNKKRVFVPRLESTSYFLIWIAKWCPLWALICQMFQTQPCFPPNSKPFESTWWHLAHVFRPKSRWRLTMVFYLSWLFARARCFCLFPEPWLLAVLARGNKWVLTFVFFQQQPHSFPSSPLPSGKCYHKRKLTSWAGKWDKRRSFPSEQNKLMSAREGIA